jgi:hypothetical protein
MATMAHHNMHPLYGIVAVGGGSCTLVYDCRGVRGDSPASASLRGYDETVFAECNPLAEFPVVDLSGFEGQLPPVRYVAEEHRCHFFESLYQPLAEYLAILRQAGVPIRRCRNGVLRPEPRDSEPEAPQMPPRQLHIVLP